MIMHGERTKERCMVQLTGCRGRRIMILAVLWLLLTGMMPVWAASAPGKITGFVGDVYYKNGKVQKKKAVSDRGNWYVLDKSGRMVRGKTYKVKGKTYRLRADGTAYTGTWMFGNKLYVYNSNGSLNKSKTNLLARYCKGSVSTKKKPFSKVQSVLGRVLHTWTVPGCGGAGYIQYYYYEHGFLIGTEVYGKKSYFSYAENTPWDPMLMS